jgi:hypothetical protein
VTSPAVSTKDSNARRPLRDVIGVTHALGTYHRTKKDFLNEGIDEILALGSRVAKLYLCSRKGHRDENYPFNSKWEKVDSLVELVQTPYFAAALAKPLTTVVLTTYAVGREDYQYYRKGFSQEDAERETKQFYELTKHLLTKYHGTRKSFVLQNWEGDWAVRGHTDAKKDPSSEAIDAMAGWLNARQAGVNQARAEASGASDVRVFHAAECNLVLPSVRSGRPSVASHVLPQTKVDLVSYSAWEAQEDPKLLTEALDFMAGHASYNDTFGHKNVYVGEFGLPEFERKPEQLTKVLDTVVPTSLRWGCPYVIFWQLYCNEAKHKPVTKNEDVRGFCLIRPDGSRNAAYAYLQRAIRQNKRP